MFVTGRRATHRTHTVEWLARHVAPSPPHDWYDTRLYMRGKTDRRPDHVVKQSILRKIRETGCEPVLAVENSEPVAEMFREAGVRVLLVEDIGRYAFVEASPSRTDERNEKDSR